MTINLTPSETTQVENARLKTRPTYYSAAGQTDITISADFEAYLILCQPAVKTAAATWIGKTVNLRQPMLDRQQLLQEALAIETINIGKLNVEISAILAPFDLWRESWQIGEFGDIPEVGMVVQDLQSNMDELAFKREQLRYLEAKVFLQNLKVLQDGLDTQKIKETSSWVGPLLAY